MNFQDLKDRLLTELKNVSDKVQESSLYIQLSEKYESLSPRVQRFTKWGAAILIVLILLSFPWGYFSNSQLYMSEFEEKRELSSDLVQQATDSSTRLQIPHAPSAGDIRGRLDRFMKDQNIPPENIKPIVDVYESSSLVPSNVMGAHIRLQVDNLNLKQAMDIATQAQGIGPTVKIKDLSLTASLKDPRYLDMNMVIVALQVPEGK